MGKHQHGGSHYQLPIEPIDFIMTNKLNFCQGNVIKYVARYDRKGTPKDDLLKAKQYIDFMLEELESDDSPSDVRGQSSDGRSSFDPGGGLQRGEVLYRPRDLPSPHECGPAC